VFARVGWQYRDVGRKSTTDNHHTASVGKVEMGRHENNILEIGIDFYRWLCNEHV
jgi:hypothetical protein